MYYSTRLVSFGKGHLPCHQAVFKTCNSSCCTLVRGTLQNNCKGRCCSRTILSQNSLLPPRFQTRLWGRRATDTLSGCSQDLYIPRRKGSPKFSWRPKARRKSYQPFARKLVAGDTALGCCNRSSTDCADRPFLRKGGSTHTHHCHGYKSRDSSIPSGGGRHCS